MSWGGVEQCLLPLDDDGFIAYGELPLILERLPVDLIKPRQPPPAAVAASAGASADAAAAGAPPTTQLLPSTAMRATRV